MPALAPPRRRHALAIALATIAIVLVGGGAYLLKLQGSPYYLLAGAAIAAAAVCAWRGNGGEILIYLAFLAVTAFWAVWEAGSSPWGLQVRLLAPAILGLWVGWSWLQRLHPLRVALGLGVILFAGIALLHASTANLAPGQGSPTAPSGDGGWAHYGNDLGGTRFSQLTQISKTNVASLRQAWIVHTGVSSGLAFEATPILAQGSLFLCTSNNIILALDPDTGRQRWRFDPKADAPGAAACRGVAYFASGPITDECHGRIVFGTTDARLIALDAGTGRPCSQFGEGGTVNLKTGMGDAPRGYYYISSAPTIVRGRIVLGGWVIDGQTTGEPSGVIRAYDAVTGRFTWAWDMGRPGITSEPPPSQTYTRGTPNSWAPMSGDEEAGLVYVPLGNATPDYWGGRRSAASETYASSVAALDVERGRLRWAFQTVHHDLWDYDVASQPTLIRFQVGGKSVPALIQPTKRGEIFVLDRRTGIPLTTVSERAVPQQPAPGDFVSRTQPFSDGMPGFDRTLLSESKMWGMTPLDQLWCRIKFRQARYDGPMTPPGVRPTITYPGYLGGVDWGGVTVDPERQLMIVNWNRVANFTRLVPRRDAKGIEASTDGDIHTGPVPQIGTPFALETGGFLSPLQMPCTEPPFGMIAAVDLRTRRIIWQHSIGTSADSGPMGIATRMPLPMGIPMVGGAITTRSGLVFIAAAQERTLRAYEVETGRRLWTARLPYAGHATPMTFASPRTGRQYVVIAAGGHRSLGSEMGDTLIAFALDKP